MQTSTPTLRQAAFSQRVAAWCGGTLWRRAVAGVGVVLLGLVWTFRVAWAAELVPQLGLHYYAIENLDDLSEVDRFVLRGKAGSQGFAHDRLILAPNTRYREWILQARTLHVAVAEYKTPGNGERFQLPAFVLHPTPAPDLDGDGLHAEAEFILGSDPENPDSDGDGVPDGAEVRSGTNPLDGLVVTTGIIASADTPGTAVDICVENDLAVVADSAAGVAIFNTFNGLNPTLIAQVDTPGTARAVACSGTLVAVADDTAGLAVIDLSTPAQARVIHQVRLGQAIAVAAAGPFGYAGVQSGVLVAVDLALGTILQRLPLGSAVHDVAVEGDNLFVATPAELISCAVTGGVIELLGRVPISDLPPEPMTGRKRLFVGGGRALVTAYPGYDVVDVRDPSAMVLAGRATEIGPRSFKQIVANGSGLGVAAVGAAPLADGTHDIYVYDISNPADTTRFQAAFQTPGVAYAVCASYGLVYGADGAAGIHVLNYLAYDTLKRPPTVTLTAGSGSGQAEEGKLVVVAAIATDDVQVRQVEFHLDGVRVATDGSFPFEHRFLAPSLAARKEPLKVRARAVDTGGNSAWSEELILALTPDATPPRVARVSPLERSLSGSIRVVTAYFNEPVDPASITARTVTLRWAGPDQIVGSRDDVTLESGVLTHRESANALLVTFPVDLAPGIYQAAILPTVADLKGNRMAAPWRWFFRVLNIQDADHDGVADGDEPRLGLDPLNEDTDGDGLIDGAEDPDADGLTNAGETLMGTDPRNPDTDGNGIRDGNEDRDLDRLSDGDEIRLGTNPLLADSDGDGWPDESEISARSDPLDPSSRPRLFVVAASGHGLLVPAVERTPGVPTFPAAVALPIVSLVIPGGTGPGGVRFGVSVAPPPVALIRPVADLHDSLAPGATVARPPVFLVIPGSTGPGGAGFGVSVAPPPVSLVLPASENRDSLASGASVARPPVSLKISEAAAASQPSTRSPLNPKTFK